MSNSEANPGAPGGLAEPIHDHNQPPQQVTTNTPNNVPVPSNNGSNEFRCLWQGCGESHPSAEVLYDHVCDKHIGRKSTNNLNLQCAWSNCSVQVVKRDHITSHIRVHVPLKPHKCTFCGKTFKRPQDLKKHVKTHADDTVLNGMHQNTARDNHQHQNGAYNMGNQSKGPSYYPEHHHMQPHPQMSYQPQGHNGAQNYYAPTQSQGYGNGYGTVSYNLGQGGDANHGSFDSSKSIASLNTFIGEVQRGIIDPKSYPQVSNRLMPLQQTGVPYVLSGGMAEFQPAPVQVDVGGGHTAAYGPSGQYSLPAIDNLRTKDQLVMMAQRFEQMAATVYEAADQAAAAGTGQPGAHYVSDAMDYRQPLPTPSLQLRSAHNESPMATSARTNHSGSTPVLTPPSSAGSYASAHSPDSTHSNPRLSPATPNGAMYPSLPGPSSAGGYPSSSMAPTATLSAQNEDDYRPRHGGGYLQKAAPMGPPPRRADEMDTSEGAPTHKESPATSPTVSAHRAPMAPMGQSQPRKAEVLPSNIDPALSGLAAPVSPSPESQLKTEEAEVEEAIGRRDARWVDTIRTLDILKSYIQHRLANNDFEVEGGEASTKREEEPQTPSLYPVLPQQVEASG